jgi:ATP-dependent Clp endopeptidase proteolytic subunit ClpP
VTEAQARARTVQLGLHGDISTEVEQEFVAELARLEKSGAPRVDLYISSGGGHVLAGMGLFSALARYPGGVDTRVDGIAASMAGILFLVGQRRRIARGAWLMLHAPWLDASGSASVLRETAATLDRLGSSLAEIVASRTGQGSEVVAEWLGRESWFSAEESVQAGLATDLDGVAPKAALAAAPLARFHALPAALARLTQEQQKMTTAEAGAGSTAGGTDALQDAVMLERSRVGEITRLAGLSAFRAALPPGWLEQHIASGSTVEQARDSIINAAADRHEATHGSFNNKVRFTGGEDHGAPDALRRRMTAALASRVSGGLIPCPDESAEFMGSSLVTMAKALLEARGHRDVRHASASRVVERAMASDGGITVGTSDFPLLLKGTGDRVLLDSYERQRTELYRLCRVTFVSDFRDITRVRRGEAPTLERVNELGEVKYGSTGEEGETFAVKTYARNFALSRNAIINDDLGAFSDFLAELGRAVSATEADLILAVFLANSLAGPVMSDGLSLFDAGHDNLMTTGSSLDVASLGEARRVLRTQKLMDGVTPLNARARFLVVPAALESTAITVLTSETQSDNSANSVRSLAEVLVEARLDALSAAGWYGFADPALHPALELAFLDGSRQGSTTNGGPLLRTFEGTNVLGTTFQCVHDVGVGVIGHRGVVRATGAA